MLEEDHQEKIFRWCEEHLDSYPQLELLFAIPNGVKRSKRYMSKLTKHRNPRPSGRGTSNVTTFK